MKAKLWLFFTLIGMINVKAQEVKGILKNDSTYLEYANVILFKKSDSSIVNTTASKANGEFNFKGLKKDSVFLQVNFIGYSDYTSSPFLGKKSFGEITLKTDNELDVVEITIKKKPFKEISAHGTNYNINNNPILKTGNAKRLITKLPGVLIKQGGNISVNGKDNATVYINGKRSYLEAKAVVNYLQTIPAEDILRVEMYDTPPARFDAEGNGAIINIVIKKPPLGTNGRVYLEAGYGNYYKISPSVSINHRSEKSNIYGSFQWRNGKRNNYQIDSTVLDPIQAEFIHNRTDRLTEVNAINAKIGYDYYQNDKNTFGIFYDYNDTRESIGSTSDVNIVGNVNNQFDSYIGTTTNPIVNRRQNTTLDFNRTVNDSTNLSADLVFIRLDIEDDNELSNQLYLSNSTNGKTLNYSNRDASINILAVKTDYDKKYKNDWKIETGVKYSYIFNDNDFVVQTGTTEDNLMLDVNSTNSFKYYESIFAGYLSLQKKWSKKWITDIGFRAEQTNIIGDSPTKNLEFTNNYFNFFPNVSVVYTPKENHQLSLLYSQRINRPYTTELNPFLKQINELEFQSGNANLLPAIENTLNFKYTFMEALNLNITGGQILNYYSQIIDQDLNSGTKVWKPENIGTANYIYSNIGSPIPIQDFWGAYLAVSHIYGDLTAGNNDITINTWSAYLGNEITLPKDWMIGISGWYSHNSYWNVWKVDPAWSTTITVNKQLGKWNFGLEIFDILDQQIFTSRAIYNDLDVYGTYKEESRKVFLNISYNFGNSKIKSAKEKDLGEEEKSRIK